MRTQYWPLSGGTLSWGLDVAVRLAIILVLIARVAQAQATPDAGVPDAGVPDAGVPDAAATGSGSGSAARTGEFEPPQAAHEHRRAVSRQRAGDHGAGRGHRQASRRSDRRGRQGRLVTPPQPVFDDAVIAAAQQFKFEPGTYGGKPVKVEITFTHTFLPPPPPTPPRGRPRPARRAPPSCAASSSSSARASRSPTRPSSPSSRRPDLHGRSRSDRPLPHRAAARRATVNVYAPAHKHFLQNETLAAKTGARGDVPRRARSLRSVRDRRRRRSARARRSRGSRCAAPRSSRCPARSAIRSA